MTTLVSKSAELETVLSEAKYFLQRIDIERSQLVFVETEREVLSTAAFIDGRSKLSITERVISVPLNEALEWYQYQGNTSSASACDRIIAHTAFCGSTLMARALDHSGHAFVYKEPQALIDLVTIKQSRHSICDQNCWPALVKLCLSQFRKSWSVDEVSMIKPSNWVNIVLPELVRYSDDCKLVLLSSTPREFLLATIRGGRDRFAYVLNFLNHIQLEFPNYGARIAGVENDKGSGLLSSLKYCIIAFHLQQRIFVQLEAYAIEHDLSGVMRVDTVSLLGQPQQCIESVAGHLALTLPKQSFTEVFGRHSKDATLPFSTEGARAVVDEIEQAYSMEIDQALAWYNDHLSGH